MVRDRVVVWSLLLLGSAGVSEGLACSCPDITPPFEQTARESRLVVLGRVSRLTMNVRGWYPFDRKDPAPVYVDVDVVRVLKGQLTSKRLRIWDQHYGSSCEGILAPLSVGVLVVVTPRRFTPEEQGDGARSRTVRYWTPPLTSGQFVLQICRENWVALKTEREADDWAERLR